MNLGFSDSFEYDLVIGIYSGCAQSVKYIDLKEFNLRFFQLQSTEFENYLKTFGVEQYEYNYKSFKDSLNQNWFLQHELYVLAPIEKNKKTDVQLINRVETILQLMYPSNLKLNDICIFKKIGQTFKWDGTVGHTVASYNPAKDSFNDSFQIKKLEARRANDFIHCHINNIKNITYLSSAVESFMSSFWLPSIEMGFLCLCISLESVTNSDTEISHQIARYCAVINAENEIDGAIIYKNVKEFYGLRSDIVHGNKYNQEFLRKHYDNFEAVVSRTLCELISHDIQDKTDLAKAVNRCGFGDKKLLSPKYKRPNFNTDYIKKLAVPVPRRK